MISWMQGMWRGRPIAELGMRLQTRIPLDIPESLRWSPNQPADMHREELANSVTHAVGFGLSMAGAGALIYFAIARAEWSWIVGTAIYAAALVAVYGFSTLSHVFRAPRPRRIFRSLDQGFIYFLVVGTFTPLALVYLEGAWFALLALVWLIAIGGFCSKVLFAYQVDAVSTSLYLVIGWLEASSAIHMVHVMPAWGVGLMLVGGLVYMLGIVFLMLDTKVRYFHAVWHILVIAGSACHYAAIMHCLTA